MKSLRTLSVLLAVVLFSFIVHELGHAIVALMLGHSIVGFEFQLLYFGIWISPEHSGSLFFVGLAGAVFQGLFLLFIAPRVVPSWKFEFKLMAALLFVYAIIEAVCVL